MQSRGIGWVISSAVALNCSRIQYRRLWGTATGRARLLLFEGSFFLPSYLYPKCEIEDAGRSLRTEQLYAIDPWAIDPWASSRSRWFSIKGANIMRYIAQFVFVGSLGTLLTALFFLSPANTGTESSSPVDHRQWSTYGGDKGFTNYSALDQINRSNVDRLKVAWTYHTNDARDRSTISTNPIVIDGVMYVMSPSHKAIALDAATGEEIWTFDPEETSGSNRGLTYWEDENGSDKRIFHSSGSDLFALDPETGELIQDFGTGGKIDLSKGLDRQETSSVRLGSPGVVYKDLLIIGSSVGEGPEPAAPGHIRAYNVRTGEREWIFHTIPHPGEFGYETWPADAWKTAGGANAWGGVSLDEERGIVFAATGSPAYDFHGGKRKGKNLFGDSVIALDAATGERIWHYQTVHHDIWDYDLPTPPTLVTVEHDGARIDAVAQPSKTGHIFVFNRETGEPLFPIVERAVPQTNLEGEETWPTQPFPLKPPPVARQGLTVDQLTDLSEEKHARALREFLKLRSFGIYTPAGTTNTIVSPGLHGGAEWGGASYDPATGMVYVNTNNIPYVLPMVSTEALISERASAGERIYTANCSSCHGSDRQGIPPSFPSLINVEERLPQDQIKDVIETGKGAMPAFGHLSEDELDALVAFLSGEKQETSQSQIEARDMPPYIHQNYYQFRDGEGYPAVKPPWGTLSAVNLNTGEIAWRVPLGEYEALSRRGVPPTGTENFGGSIVTAGGLVFIAATRDKKFRAFDKASGEVLWETPLETGAFATPSTYAIDGKQYVVIAVGGNCKYCGQGSNKLDTKPGDAYVAFALP